MNKFLVIAVFCQISALNVFSGEMIPIVEPEPQTIEVKWLSPEEESFIGQYEKLELEVQLTDRMYLEIENFLNRTSGVAEINPFDPQQIDVKAEFWLKEEEKWLGPELRYGFFFNDFERDTTSVDVEDWGWNKTSENQFRVRFAPRYTGMWRCKVSVKVNHEEYIANEFTFECVPSDHGGFMEIADNHRNFEVDNETFLPVGVNLGHPRWVDDPVKLRQGTAEYWYKIRKMPAMPMAYLNFLEDMENLAGSGGNYFRMMLFPYVNDIEFEQLNDYSERMHVAWEMDRIFEHAEELGLKIHFDLTWANELNTPERCYNKVYWNWYANDYPHVDDDHGYCYMHELGLKEPFEFLQSEEARKYYKYKLRYMMSRWGYSTSIGLYEIMNEANLIFPDHPKELYDWNREMSRFIKEEIKSVHPVAVNYIPHPDLEHGDSSYYLPYVDVITFNKYRVSVTKGDFVEDVRTYEEIGKPLFYSEMGFGWGEHESCEKWSDYGKDAWMSALCGLAGMGLEWHQQRSPKLHARYFKPVEKFIGKTDLREFTENETDLRKDRKAEMVAVKDIDFPRALGVVHNTTWNYYTNRKNDASKCGTTVPKEEFSAYEDVASEGGGNALKISGMQGMKKYRIEWYDTKNNALIQTSEDRAGITGKVKLDYPKLTKDTPVVAFKLFQMKDGSFIPSAKEEPAHSIPLKEDTSVPPMPSIQ